MTSALRRLRFSAFAALLGLAVSLSPALAQLGPGGGGGGGGGGGTSSSFSTTFPSIGTAIGASDGTNMKPLLVDGSGYLEVNIKAGAGSGGTALADEAAFTQGTTDITPIGCLYITSYSALSTGQAGVMQCDSAGRPKVVGAGTAGTATGGVLTVQGVASMTPVQVSQATAASLNATVVGTGTFAVQATLQASATTAIGKVDPNTIATWGLATVGAGSAPTNMEVGGLVYNSGGVTPSSGQSVALQGDANGYLQVNVKTAPTIAVTGTFYQATQPVSGTFWQTTQPVSLSGDQAVNLAQVGGASIALGNTTESASLPVTLASNQATLAVTQDVSQLFNGVTGTAATVTKTKISVASATTTTVVALTSGKKIRVLAMYLVSGAACNINWQSHTTTANADGVQDLAANGGIVLPFNPIGWFDTTSGEALDLVTSTNAQVGGYIITTAV